MKTAISLSDEVYRHADRTAKRLGKSRSQLYREAVVEYIARHDPEEVTAAMNRVCDNLDSGQDPHLGRAARRLLKSTEW